jgi:hypothetical protein
MIKRIGYILLVLSTVWGCGSTPPPPKSVEPVGEAFDPLLLGEDLLLIQPEFSKPPPVPAAVDPFDSVEELAAVYRVQAIALSDQERADLRALSLEDLLHIPVQVERVRGLYLLRLGAFATASEAEGLRRRLVRLHPDYASAFVVDTQGPGWVGTGPEGSGEEMVIGADSLAFKSVFGWRILLDESNRYEDAVKLAEEARRRLGRDDIDITFAAPYYKVQVGHFRTETEAKELYENLVYRRYSGALKVRGEILVPKEGP